MIYEISHRTAYRYQLPVPQSQHLVHLAPRQAERQTITRHSLMIEPAPSWRSDFLDYFGNPASVLAIEEEHKEFVIHARSTIQVEARESIVLDLGPPWSDVFAIAATGRNEIDIDVVQYALPSPVTRAGEDVVRFAQSSFVPGRSVLAAAWDLTCRIFDEFKFDSTATDVSTPISQVLAQRRGVCQDFSHLALACLRAMRVPSRYVSGYLLTHPPLGREKLKGADTSHAWLSVWSPDTGWVDFDPTNRLIPTDQHITFAYGREFADISPIGGVLLGGGEHMVEVAVDVDQAPPSQPDSG
jgi:transglutaminase-like putative cysteine protease